MESRTIKLKNKFYVFLPVVYAILVEIVMFILIYAYLVFLKKQYESINIDWFFQEIKSYWGIVSIFAVYVIPFLPYIFYFFFYVRIKNFSIEEMKKLKKHKLDVLTVISIVIGTLIFTYVSSLGEYFLDLLPDSVTKIPYTSFTMILICPILITFYIYQIGVISILYRAIKKAELEEQFKEEIIKYGLIESILLSDEYEPTYKTLKELSKSDTKLRRFIKNSRIIRRNVTKNDISSTILNLSARHLKGYERNYLFNAIDEIIKNKCIKIKKEEYQISPNEIVILLQFRKKLLNS